MNNDFIILHKHFLSKEYTKAMKARTISIKRAYDTISSQDGSRILIDRLWPRGVSKEGLKLTDWEKELSPSTELRTWFNHDPLKWTEFKKRYKQELKDKHDIFLKLLTDHPKLTLIYAAKDTEHNNAVVLKEILESLTNK